MGRRSSIELLDPALKQAVDDALRRGHKLLDIVELVRGMGGEVSKSAVGRYKLSFEESLSNYRHVQGIAGQWISEFRANPDSDVGRLLAEMCKVIAFRAAAEANQSDEPLDMLALNRLARTVKAVTDTDRVKAEMEAAVRKKVAEEAADTAAEAGRQAGLSAERVAQLRRDVLGLRAAPVPAAPATPVEH